VETDSKAPERLEGLVADLNGGLHTSIDETDLRTDLTVAQLAQLTVPYGGFFEFGEGGQHVQVTVVPHPATDCQPTVNVTGSGTFKVDCAGTFHDGTVTVNGNTTQDASTLQFYGKGQVAGEPFAVQPGDRTVPVPDDVAATLTTLKVPTDQVSFTIRLTGPASAPVAVMVTKDDCPLPPVNCTDGTTVPAGQTCPPVKCPDGSTVPNGQTCPQPPPPVNCADGSQVPSGLSCPPVKCADGTSVPNGQVCQAQTVVVVVTPPPAAPPPVAQTPPAAPPPPAETAQTPTAKDNGLPSTGILPLDNHSGTSLRSIAITVMTLLAIGLGLSCIDEGQRRRIKQLIRVRNR
jgi:hypothetical protein